MGTRWVHRGYTKLLDIGGCRFNLLESSDLPEITNPLLDVP